MTYTRRPRTHSILLTASEKAVIKKGFPDIFKNRGLTVPEEEVYAKIADKINNPGLVKKSRSAPAKQRLSVKEAQALISTVLSLMEGEREKIHKGVDFKRVRKLMEQNYGVKISDAGINSIYNRTIRRKLNLPKLWLDAKERERLEKEGY